MPEPALTPVSVYLFVRDNAPADHIVVLDHFGVGTSGSDFSRWKKLESILANLKEAGAIGVINAGGGLGALPALHLALRALDIAGEHVMDVRYVKLTLLAN